ncbi:DUF2007 domain-containing protein [Candidatus Calescamantes bacterium]|nr:DUF2007 domain-containing protein [Candidatus Calescamantes bacterium]
MKKNRTVKVYTAKDEFEANLIKGLLESEGIPCNLITQVPHSVYPFTVDGLAEVQIMVREEDADRAREIIESKEGEKNNQL